MIRISRSREIERYYKKKYQKKNYIIGWHPLTVTSFLLLLLSSLSTSTVLGNNQNIAAAADRLPVKVQERPYSMQRFVERQSGSKNIKINNRIGAGTTNSKVDGTNDDNEKSSVREASTNLQPWLPIHQLLAHTNTGRSRSNKEKVDDLEVDDAIILENGDDDDDDDDDGRHLMDDDDDKHKQQPMSIEMISAQRQHQHGSSITVRGGGISSIGNIDANGSISRSSSNIIFSLASEFAKYVGASKTRSWVVLIIAIIAEIFATTLLKTASDTSDANKLIYSLILYVFSLLSFAACLKQIEVSIAYAIWSALGTALVSIAGVCMFGEKASVSKIVSLTLIMAGVVGLNLNDEGGH